MKITLHGAGGGEVTGSAYLVQTKYANVLVDCGSFQGKKKLENYYRLPREEAIAHLDAVILTHAHQDHTGRLPLLTRVNYSGPIYATPATIEFTDLLLRDSVHLMKDDVERENRKRIQQGQPPLEVLYTLEEVDELSPLYRPLKYDYPTEIAPGIVARVVEAGHIAGSVSIEMTIEENGTRRVVVFSGDLGPRGVPLHKDPVPFKHADMVFMETTYGTHDHPSLQETALEAREVIRKAMEAKGKILVPVFAVGRAQMLLYLLAGAFERKTLPPFPIYLDSPMAIEATQIYGRHAEVFDEEALAMHQSGDLRRGLETVMFSPPVKDSQKLNDLEGPLHDHGRIRHVHRRAHPAPLAAQFIQPAKHGDLRGLPVPRIPGPQAGGRCRERVHLWREDPGAGHRAHPWRAERACRADRPVELVRFVSILAAAGNPDPWRG